MAGSIPSDEKQSSNQNHQNPVKLKQTKFILSIRELALYAMLGALLFGLKMALAALPNIEPVSLLIMLYAVCFGWKSLFAVYLYIFLEIAIWGIGLWNIAYFYIWLILFIVARLFSRMQSRLGWAVLSGSFGLFFGGFCSLVYWAVGGWAFALSWWIAGIPMDLLHGTGNFVLALILFCPSRRQLSRLIQKYKI